ncbi:hypothetical protein HK105_200028 [Polyrhizophydium stewartii]|uniref:C2H2-type domain-containing protein n=1 Tax=Polyrhizophydium stewartii TaxID=2732419 RepID=A0ABR4NKB1_9FUNG
MAPHSPLPHAQPQQSQHNQHHSDSHAHSHHSQQPPRADGRSTRGAVRKAAVARPRRHACGHCAAAFQRAEHLDRHVLTHSGARPFACARCARGFARLAALQRHVKMHPTSDDDASSDGGGDPPAARGPADEAPPSPPVSAPASPGSAPAALPQPDLAPPDRPDSGGLLALALMCARDADARLAAPAQDDVSQAQPAAQPLQPHALLSISSLLD